MATTLITKKMLSKTMTKNTTTTMTRTRQLANGSQITKGWPSSLLAGESAERAPLSTAAAAGASTSSASTVSSRPSSSTQKQPELVQVPTLPVLGSLIPSHSGAPEYKPENSLYFWPEMNRRFGDFYSFGLPGMGYGWHGTMYIITDPNEMATLLRQEGQYPSGTAQFNFAMRHYLQDRNNVAQWFFDQGPEWKRVRQFVQTDLLSVASTAKYLPGICEAAWYAARGAPVHSSTVNQYLNWASFDMFATALFGHNPRITDPEYETNLEDIEFCEAVVAFLRAGNKITLNLSDRILVQTLKLPLWSKNYQILQENLDQANRFSAKKVQNIEQKRQNSTLSELERNCYANTAFERYEQQHDQQDTKTTTTTKQHGKPLSIEEVRDVIQILLAAGVDTTGANIAWKVLHLAYHPEAQQRIAQEQQEFFFGNDNTKKQPGQQYDPIPYITPDSILPANAPYLHACIRESHRLAHPASPAPLRRFPQGITVHGVPLPPHARVGFDAYSKGVDPAIVGDDFRGSGVLDFCPDRFEAQSVEERKGTPAALALDHVMNSGPFSQGARKCPASRVAHMETAALLASLCSQWEFSLATDTAAKQYPHWTNVPYGFEALITCQVPELQFTPRHS